MKQPYYELSITHGESYQQASIKSYEHIFLSVDSHEWT